MAQQPQPVAPIVSIEAPDSFAFGPAVLAPEAGGTKPTNGIKDPNRGPVTRLDVLSDFTGTFRGFGFNTIFRPSSTATPSVKTNVHTNDPDDNVLQLNLTAETMAFSSNLLDDVPNRGLGAQADITLSGVPYTQSILDTTVIVDKGLTQPVIHFEPGLWMRVPASTTSPELKASFCRMASIPHGTTINAQCFQPEVTKPGAPVFPNVSITPIIIAGNSPHKFENQTAANSQTRRIPQDLTSFIKDGTITQDMLTNPNIVLTNANKGKNIIQNTTFTVATEPSAPGLGGGTSNIGFLIGTDAGLSANDNDKKRGNANAARVTAQYWVSKVRTTIHLDPCLSWNGDNNVEKKTVSPKSLGPRDAVPTFIVDKEIKEAKDVEVEYTQIQYSQMVQLDFNSLSWPHITVSTLAPIGVELSSIEGLVI